jgi:hypothetical protein
MNARTIGHRLFTGGVTRPVYEDERTQFIRGLLPEGLKHPPLSRRYNNIAIGGQRCPAARF